MPRFDSQAYEELVTSSTDMLIRNGGPDFKKLGINLTDFLRNGEFSSEQSRLDHFLYDMLARCANEIVSIYSVLRGGSYQGSIQHIRALIEVHMSVTYMFSELSYFIDEDMLRRRNDTVEAATRRETVENRVEKYLQYKSIRTFLYFKDLKEKLDNGLSESDLWDQYGSRREWVERSINAVDSEVIEKWELLFATSQRAFPKIRAWHSPYSIEDLLNLVLNIEAGSTETYDLLCQFTHISPFQFFFKGGNKTLGLTDETIRQVLHDAEVLVRGVFKRIDDSNRLHINLTEKFTDYTPGPHR